MRTDAEPMNIISLGKKLENQFICTEKNAWLIYKGALVFSEILMTGLAFRLAYFLRFETSFTFFAENAVVWLKIIRHLLLLLPFSGY